MTDDREIRISVIVPIYNVEKYVRECINSIVDQTPYELIIVDDGSNDESGKICDEYAIKYAFVKVFHKGNGGLSDARNYGIKNATGEYLVFVDGDDYIGDGSIEALKKSCLDQVKPDVILMRYCKFKEKGKIIYEDKELNEKKLRSGYEQALSYIADLDKYPASACKKCVKRELIVENDIFFKVGQLSEDYEWTLKLFLATKSFGCCNEYKYFYRMGRIGSITNSIGDMHVHMLIDIIDIFIDTAKKQGKEVVKQSVYSFAAFIYRVLLYQGLKFYDMNKEKIDDKSYLLNYKQSKEVRCIRLSMKIFGVRNTVKLLDIYKIFARKYGR